LFVSGQKAALQIGCVNGRVSGRSSPIVAVIAVMASVRAGKMIGGGERGLGVHGSILEEWPVGAATLSGCGLSTDQAGIREPLRRQPIERWVRAARWRATGAKAWEW
jgi:hypothetical protein